VCGFRDQARADCRRKGKLDQISHLRHPNKDDPVAHKCIGRSPLVYRCELTQPKGEAFDETPTRRVLLIFVVLIACEILKYRPFARLFLVRPVHHLGQESFSQLIPHTVPPLMQIDLTGPVPPVESGNIIQCRLYTENAARRKSPAIFWTWAD